MDREFSQGWEFLQQLPERDADIEPLLHRQTGLGEKQRIETQLVKRRLRLGLRQIDAGQLLEHRPQAGERRILLPAGPSGRRRVRSRLVARLKIARGTGLAVALGMRCDGFYPMALPLERIGGQRQLPTAFALGKSGPVHRHACEPEPAQRFQHHREVGVPSARRPEGTGHGFARRDVRVLSRQRAQRLAGANLQQKVDFAAGQFAETVRKTHRPARMLDPIGRVRRLRSGHPPAGHIGNPGKPGRLQFHLFHLLQKQRQHRLHQLRVKRVRRYQPPAGRAVPLQPGLKIGDRLEGSRNHAQLRRIDGRQREPRGQQFAQRLLRHPHRDHHPGRLTLHQPGADNHQRERILQCKDTGQAGGHILAETVADHRLRTDAPMHP